MRNLPALLTSRALTASGAVMAEVMFMLSRLGMETRTSLPSHPIVIFSGLFCERSEIKYEGRKLVCRRRPSLNIVTRCPISLQIRQNFLLRHVPKFRLKNGALARVATLTEGHNNLLSAESGHLQYSLRMNAGSRLQNYRVPLAAASIYASTDHR